MGKLRQTALILGEGPTEFFYFKSLCDVFKRLTIKPDYPKHTNIKELDAKIAEGVAMGYSHIFCIIDMDTKDKEPDHSQYQKLKAKYAKPINKPKKGIYCEVEFFETHRCTELFFLYYFRYTSRLFVNHDIFALKGKSITYLDDLVLLRQIADFVCLQQTLYKKGEDSFFRNINSCQSSYPGKGFCSAAIRQLLKYYAYDKDEEKAWAIVNLQSNGKRISKELTSLFRIDKEGHDISVTLRVRLGQNYFRKMVMKNFRNKCCITGLNVPQTLRASHIVAWASDKNNRMNPENGLCLSATYDAAFDKHLISFDDDYRMIVSKEIKDYYTNKVTKKYFGSFEGKRMILPSLYMPSKKLLEKHRSLMIG